MYYLINGLIGAAVAIAIAYISRTSSFFLAGLLPLFPTFSLFAHITAFNSGGTPQVREVAIFGILSIFSYFSYLIGLLVMMQSVRFAYAVIIALCIWAVAAAAIIYLWKSF